MEDPFYHLPTNIVEFQLCERPLLLFTEKVGGVYKAALGIGCAGGATFVAVLLPKAPFKEHGHNRRTEVHPMPDHARMKSILELYDSVRIN